MIKIVQIEPAEAKKLLFEDYGIHMIDITGADYYLDEYQLDQVTLWIRNVINGTLQAAFYYLEVSDAAE